MSRSLLYLQRFSSKQVGQIMSVALDLEREGFSPDEIIAAGKIYFQKLIDKNPISSIREKQPISCPLCGDVVQIQQVNVSRCTAIGGAWKSIQICNNKNCPFTELSEKTREDLKKCQ